MSKLRNSQGQRTAHEGKTARLIVSILHFIESKLWEENFGTRLAKGASVTKFTALRRPTDNIVQFDGIIVRGIRSQTFGRLLAHYHISSARCRMDELFEASSDFGLEEFRSFKSVVISLDRYSECTHHAVLKYFGMKGSLSSLIAICFLRISAPSTNN
ncbi:hypothetical protein L218DRAFT_943763 [Marasmius fiardii PR-910]|nr:hypothetical protein L218DRAFT_943763 [Marasmius fiardii PR-910]